MITYGKIATSLTLPTYQTLLKCRCILPNLSMGQTNDWADPCRCGRRSSRELPSKFAYGHGTLYIYMQYVMLVMLNIKF